MIAKAARNSRLMSLQFRMATTSASEGTTMSFLAVLFGNALVPGFPPQRSGIRNGNQISTHYSLQPKNRAKSDNALAQQTVAAKRKAKIVIFLAKMHSKSKGSVD
jgi:hypothetical protein